MVAITLYDTVVVGGTVVSGSGRKRCDVAVRDGKVVAMGFELRGDRIIDASGQLVLPGIIDAHVHPIHAETMKSVSEAAVYGGVTTLLHYVYVGADRSLVAGLAEAREVGQAESLLDFGLHAGVGPSPTRVREFDDALAMGVTSFKFFMAYRKRGLLTPDEDLLRSMQVLGSRGALALVHAENGSMIDVLEEDRRGKGPLSAEEYPSTRPAAAEAEAVNRACALARVAECGLYVVHISSGEALDAAVRARSLGQRVYTETCPHYLTLTADDAMLRFGSKAKIAPPLRTADDVETLWRGIVGDRIDVVGSDHSEFDRSEKETSDDLFDAGFGAPGIESMLVVMHDAGVNTGRISLEKLVSLLAEAPARIFGLPEKGRVAVGADADLVIFDPAIERVLAADDMHGNGYYSLYEGRRVKGWPRMVMQRGQIVMEGGKLVAEPGDGLYLARESTEARSAWGQPFPMAPATIG